MNATKLTSAPLFFLVILSLIHHDLACPEVEKQALLEFKHSLTMTGPFNPFSSWSTEISCCEWTGVVCDNFTGHVRQISLQAGFAGKLSPSLITLKHLRYLSLSNNNFSGEIIPSFIGSLTRLQYLDLSNSGFHGIIPPAIGNNLTSLQYLNLAKNFLAGTIPDYIGNLVSLHTLYIQDNGISGKIPEQISNLSRIRWLDMSKNQLQGEIPKSIGNMSLLQEINFGQNQLTGVLPTTLEKLSSLNFLWLPGNKLIGDLPQSFEQLHNLTSLSVEDNMLTGIVTENHFANLTKLKTFYASGNQMTLKVKLNWVPPFQLWKLGLGSWNLGRGAEIPPWLAGQKNIKDLDLSNIGLSGTVPGWIWQIKSYNLSHNNLHGEIPDIIETRDGPHYICMSYNKFTGPLPRVPGILEFLDLSNNLLTGGLSHFLCSKTEQHVIILLLEGNQLSGELPDCWKNWRRSLGLLNLGNNNLSGSIPNSIGMSELFSLNLHGNKLSGQIPNSLMNATNLWKINLNGNNLEGNIPTWIGTDIPTLRFLMLSSNKLSGEIPSAICHLKALQLLDLSGNSFSGRIPSCIGNLTAMAKVKSSEKLIYFSTFIESASVRTKGMDLIYDTILMLVTSMDLSRNNLSGEIPKELTRLVELRSLNLSNNHLVGSIPSDVGDMKKLESFDLSRNFLSGEIPSSLAVLSSLSYVNLSCNNLTGKIPESTQLQRMNPSSFFGNNLCGPPLTRNCSHGHDQYPVGEEKSEHEKSEVRWLYVFVSLGYAVGFSAACTALVLKRTWRDTLSGTLEDIWNKIYVCFHINWRTIRRQLVQRS